MIKRLPRKLKKKLLKEKIPYEMYIDILNELFLQTPKGTKYMADRCRNTLETLKDV